MGSTEHSSEQNNTPETPRSECLSSNSTLFYRIFVPVFGTVFFLGFVLALNLIPEDDLYLPFPAWWARVAVIIILLGWLFFVKTTIWRLKRVDATSEYFFVTNYWHTVRYPWHDAEQITESKRLGRRLVHLHLRAPGRFGRVISFLPARHYDELMKNFGIREN